MEASTLVSTWQYPIILELHVPVLRPNKATKERMTENVQRDILYLHLLLLETLRMGIAIFFFER